MRILLVTPSYYPNIGGVEYVVGYIAERLVARCVTKRPARSYTRSIERHNYRPRGALVKANGQRSYKFKT